MGRWRSSRCLRSGSPLRQPSAALIRSAPTLRSTRVPRRRRLRRSPPCRVLMGWPVKRSKRRASARSLHRLTSRPPRCPTLRHRSQSWLRATIQRPWRPSSNRCGGRWSAIATGWLPRCWSHETTAPRTIARRSACSRIPRKSRTTCATASMMPSSTVTRPRGAGQALQRSLHQRSRRLPRRCRQHRGRPVARPRSISRVQLRFRRSTSWARSLRCPPPCLRRRRSHRRRRLLLPMPKPRRIRPRRRNPRWRVRSRGKLRRR